MEPPVMPTLKPPECARYVATGDTSSDEAEEEEFVEPAPTSPVVLLEERGLGKRRRQASAKLIEAALGGANEVLGGPKLLCEPTQRVNTVNNRVNTVSNRLEEPKLEAEYGEEGEEETQEMETEERVEQDAPKSMWRKYLEDVGDDDEEIEMFPEPVEDEPEGPVYECERDCGFEDTCLETVEAHEATCTFVPPPPSQEFLEKERLESLLERAEKTESGYVGVYRTKGLESGKRTKWLARIHCPKECYEPESEACAMECVCKRKVEDLGRFKSAIEAARARRDYLLQAPWSNLSEKLYTGGDAFPEAPSGSDDVVEWLRAQKAIWEAIRLRKSGGEASVFSAVSKPRLGRPPGVRSPNGAPINQPWARSGKPGRPKKLDPDAPKAARTAYVFFQKDVKAALIEEHPQYSFSEIGREQGKRWNSLSEEEKIPWRIKADVDKLRAIRELEAYKLTLPNLGEPEQGPNILGENVNQKGLKRRRDPNAPKGPFNPYYFYTEATKGGVKESNPEDYGYKVWDFSSLGQELGARYQRDNPNPILEL